MTYCVYLKKNITAESGKLYQWDYGQELMLFGVQLPESYVVHFAHDPSGDAISVTGDSNGVGIPDSLLESGRDILGWVTVTDGDTRTTEYRFKLGVIKRAKPTEPIPVIIPAEGVEF